MMNNEEFDRKKDFDGLSKMSEAVDRLEQYLREASMDLDEKIKKLQAKMKPLPEQD